MSRSFSFDQLDAFVAGAVGPPGARTFYLQARTGTQVVSFKAEKEQVAMLGRYLGQLASAMGPVEADRDVVGLVEPVEPEWSVGALAVGVDEEAGVIHVTAEELTGDTFGEDVTDEYIDELLEVEPDGAEARFTLTLGQAVAFAEAAQDLMEAGRPPCRLCGRPIGPEGHACPRWN